MARVILQKGREGRALAGHPWIYRDEIARVEGAWTPDEAVAVHARDGTFIGRGFYNPKPAIACRILTRRDEPIDLTFFRRRVETALAYRRGVGLGPPAYPPPGGGGGRLPGRAGGW